MAKFDSLSVMKETFRQNKKGHLDDGVFNYLTIPHFKKYFNKKLISIQ